MLLIKIGGGQDTNFELISQDIANISNNSSEQIIFVHGANAARDQLATDLGKPTKRIVSPSGMTSVHTDEQAIEILTMAYAGLINKRWVSHFIQNNVQAVGLSGIDGKLLVGQRKKVLISQVEDTLRGTSRKVLIRNTYTGRVNQVNTDLLNILLDGGYMPVITQPAVTEDGVMINTDNDLNSALIASEMNVEKMVVLFEAPGMLRDINDPDSLIRKISREELPNMLPFAKGTMKKKVLGAMEALDHGVKEIYWGDSRIKDPISNALAGKGTIIS
ncbi:MAG: [LysW]-aminoadipate kinase [Candidatus Pacebacteria bacterium]|nr:[LysW]-aminoadipate kinase [Candidatus Paceibacterota bacterium]